jgi:putative ABC transport system permease protein
VNTLTVSITDRRRELGVLRAVGALQGQVKRTIRIEALAVAGIALCLGFGLGAANLAFALSVVRKDIAGVHLDYRFPAVVAMQVIPVILLAAALAALWPSRAAVRAPLVEALEYE